MHKHITLTPLEALQKHPLFAEVPLVNLEEILPHTSFQKTVKDEVILGQGQIATHLILLVAGQIQVIKRSADGRDLSIQTLTPGSIAGEASVIDGAPNEAAIISQTEAIIAKLPAAIAMQLFTKMPQLAERMLKHLCLTLRHTNLLQSVLTLNRAHTRIFSFLLNAAKPQTNNVMTIEGLPNQQALANIINVSRETISRALQLLIKDGIIEKQVKCIVIKNPAKLGQLARGENVATHHHGAADPAIRTTA